EKGPVRSLGFREVDSTWLPFGPRIVIRTPSKAVSMIRKLARSPAVAVKVNNPTLSGAVIVTVFVSPKAILPKYSTVSPGWGNGGGMMKSSLLVAVPRDVVTVIGPEAAAGGTMVVMLVVVA